MWIKVEDELPIQKFNVRVKNGMAIANASYYRKKWYTWRYDDELGEYVRGRKLHKVIQWWKCPVSYPKIPRRDMQDFIDRAKKYKHQFQYKRMVFGPANPTLMSF